MTRNRARMNIAPKVQDHEICNVHKGICNSFDSRRSDVVASESHGTGEC
jgi:hypothetical protein